MPEDAWHLICDTTYFRLCVGDMKVPRWTAHMIVPSRLHGLRNHGKALRDAVTR